MPKTLAIVIELVILICALWILAFLSFLLHELGHALGYMLATRGRHWHIRVGWGKRLLSTKRLSVNLFVLDGVFMPEDDKIDTRAKCIMTLLGGPIVSLGLVVGLLCIKFGGISIHSDLIASSAIESFISIAAFFNLSSLLMSVIPTHYFWGAIKGMETDGLQIINAFKNYSK